MNWILASASPRRQELLKILIQDFQVIPSEIDEIISADWSIDEIALELAKLKALEVSSKQQNSLVIASDTVVRVEDQILAKPENEQHAREMLELLSGRYHVVQTAVCIAQNSEIIESCAPKTEVHFKELSSSEISTYIDSGEPFGKAGSYAIQGLGSIFIKKINGCFYNVVGLPIFNLNQILEKLNYERNRKSNALG